jgi:hypothetical protein
VRRNAPMPAMWPKQLLGYQWMASWPPSRSALFGWWYVSIGAGFLLLALNRLIVGGVPWLVAIRFLIAAGFFILGYFELKGKFRR